MIQSSHISSTRNCRVVLMLEKFYFSNRSFGSVSLIGLGSLSYNVPKSIICVIVLNMSKHKFNGIMSFLH